jgi:hypothetical protein
MLADLLLGQRVETASGALVDADGGLRGLGIHGFEVGSEYEAV